MRSGGRGSSFNNSKSNSYKNFENNADEADKFFGVNTGGDNDVWYDSLKPSEVTLINGYTGSDYSEMNDYLRNQEKYNNTDGISFWAAKMKAQTGDIQRAITKSPLKANLVVYRYDYGGLVGTKSKSELMKKYKIGDVIETKGFLSTSVERKTGFGNVGYEIKLKKGSRAGQYIAGVSHFHSEHEFLVKNGAKLRLTGFSEHKGTTIVKLEYME